MSLVTCAAGACALAAVAGTPASATSGDAAAYAATPVAARPATPPANTAASYTGPQLHLRTYQVGQNNLGYEPMVGVDRRGAVFENARFTFGCIPNPYDGCAQIQEQSIFRSDDSGSTWTDISGGPSQHWTSQDPYLYVDPDTGRVFWLDIVIGGATLSLSDDDGSTWTTNHIADVGMNDRPTMVTAYPPANAGLVPTDTAFPKIAYYCTNTIAAVSCARSLDGGRTFVPIPSPLLPMSEGGCSSQTGHMAADHDGRVYISGADCGVPYVAMSDDGGQTWNNVLINNYVDETVSAIGSGNLEYNFPLAVDAAGTLYAALISNHDNLLYLFRSYDHGAHWDTPLMVSPPGITASVYPGIAAGDPGRVTMSFVGTTGDPSDSNRPWSQYVLETTDATAAAPLFLSDVAVLQGTGATPDTTTTIVGRGSDCCSAMKDFLNVVTAPIDQGRIWASISDACTGACVDDPNGLSDNKNVGRAFVVRQTAGPPLVGDAADIGPGAVVPDAPNAALLPLIAASVLGAGLGIRRRRRGADG